MPEYGESGPPSGYQEDHLISLELGGNPTDPAQPLARALPARGRRRQDRERAQRQGLLRRAHPRRGAARRVGAEARARVSLLYRADARMVPPPRRGRRSRSPDRRSARSSSSASTTTPRRIAAQVGWFYPTMGAEGLQASTLTLRWDEARTDRDPRPGRRHARDRGRHGERRERRARPLPAPLDGVHRRREVRAVDRSERLRQHRPDPVVRRLGRPGRPRVPDRSPVRGDERVQPAALRQPAVRHVRREPVGARSAAARSPPPTTRSRRVSPQNFVWGVGLSPRGNDNPNAASNVSTSPVEVPRRRSAPGSRPPAARGR